MGCRILTNDSYQAFYCSTLMQAFGPIMYGDAEEFFQWLKEDPRHFSTVELIGKYSEFQVEKSSREVTP